MKRLVQTAAVALLLAPAAGFGQLICTGDACSCEEEKTPPPNFSVSKAVHVTGLLVDETGAPFVFENTIVQVRTVKEKAVIVTSSVDSQGRFDLGIVPAGQYRLIAARRLQNGTLERQPLADQPKPIACPGEADCSITAVQHIHGTELPFEFCPPQ
ncbi:MAG: carboxypeptidase-like regulatory domain-containing protein [Terracidiphilus sp.]